MTTRITSNQQSALSSIRDVMACEADAINIVAQRLNDSISVPLDLLYEQQGRIILTGIGKMGCVGRKAAATFCSTGTPAVFLHAAEAAHGDLGIVTKKDVLMALSYSGQTVEVLNLLPYMHRFGVPVISVTGNSDSELARRSRYVIDIAVPQEADPNELAPTASTTVALAMCDALAIALARRRGFTREQFALFHPGGNLGRRLLLTTKDVMHAGRDLPKVSLGVKLRDAIVMMSQKRLGSVVVVDADERIVGILTDGDVRRILEKHANPLGLPIEELMSRDPTQIHFDALAAESLRLMQEKEITVLPVVQDDGTLCGMVHLHDLLRVGLA